MPEFKPRKPILATLASFGAPCLGQIYNGQPQKALWIYLLSISLYLLVYKSGFVLSFSGLVFIFLCALTFLILMTADAWIWARKQQEYVLKKYNLWWVYIAFSVVHLFIITPFIEELLFPLPIKAYKVPAASMQPTIEIGDHLIVNLNAYKNTPPQRGDIIVFPFPEDPSKSFIKRIIALPGEVIEIKNTKIFINNEAIADPWGVYTDQTISRGGGKKRDSLAPLTIEPGKYFVLGDNRDHSLDSRFIGLINALEIKGKASYIYWAKDKSRIGKKLF